MSRWVTALLVIAAAAGACANDGSQVAPAPADDELTELAVGVIPIVDVAPIYLGEQQGFFADAGIDLELETAQGGAAIVPSVLSGDLDVGFSNVTSLMTARDQGMGVQIVASGSASTGEQGEDYTAVVVPDDSDIDSAADLEGRQVAVNTLQNIGDTTVRSSVREDGGDPQAVEFVELPFSDMQAALIDDQVDAIWVSEPFLTLALNDGGREVASTYVDPAPDLTVATYFAAEERIDEDPEQVEAFADAMERANRYAEEHPDEARDVLARYTELDEDVRAELRLPSWPGELNSDALTTLGELGARDGLLDEPPDLDALVR